MATKTYLIILLSFFCLPIYAQKNGSYHLTANQNWVLNQYRKFLKTSGIHIDSAVAIQQYAERLKAGCQIDCTSILSVEGLKLEGRRLNASQTELTFFTYTEKNNLGFVVQHSLSDVNHFDSVGFVNGSLNSFVEKAYRFIDENSYSGYSFYRLKQVDIDGRSTYSNIVKIEGASSQASVAVIPNPTSSDNINIRLTGFMQNKLNIVVTDVNGQTVYSRQNQDAPNSVFRLPVRYLSPGLYHIRVFNAEKYANTNFLVR